MYQLDRVEVSFQDEQKGVWKFAGRLCKGTKFLYQVDDHNYYRRNRWEFVVQVPDAWTKGNYLNVRPVLVPNRRAWAGLELRAISFQRATIGRYRGKVYAKLAIADIAGEKTKRVLNKEDKQSMPRWLREFVALQKQRVTTSSGYDGEQLVTVIHRDDHVRMITLFLALKAWVLDRKYDPKEARESAVRRRLRQRRSGRTNSLRGKVVAVTGRLGHGDRSKVYRWLRNLGAQIGTHATSRTDLLIVGAHYAGEDRAKIRYARKHHIPMHTEARFRQAYAV
jgi:NAD-dependent DNA ligase